MPEDRFLGVRGYQPRHVETVDSLVEQDGGRLRAIRGERLLRSFVVWEAGEQTWFRDGPLILDFGVTRLELAAFKFHLCVSWDSIDVAEPVDWYAGSSFRLEWREDAVPELDALRGGAIESLRVVDYRGALNGLQFCSGPACVEVLNALDEFGITNAPDVDPEIMRREV